MGENIGLIFDDFADEYLQENNERNIIIVASSKIDDTLSEIISLFFLPKIDKKNKQDELLDGDRPLATFSSRIKVVYRLGIIHKSFYDILEKIRDIRNASAHQIQFDLSKSPLKEKIQNLLSLLVDRESYRSLRKRYYEGIEMDKNDEIKCVYLTVCLLLFAVKTKVSRVNENIETVKITTK